MQPDTRTRTNHTIELAWSCCSTAYQTLINRRRVVPDWWLSDVSSIGKRPRELAGHRALAMRNLLKRPNMFSICKPMCFISQDARSRLKFCIGIHPLNVKKDISIPYSMERTRC